MDALRRIRLEPLLPTTAKRKPPHDASEVPAHSASGLPPEPGTCPRCREPAAFVPDEQHIECHNCHAMYCWLCGKDIGDEHPDFVIHFQWWNVFGCQGYCRSKYARPNPPCHYRLLQVLVPLVLGLPSLICGSVIWLVCLGFLPCSRFTNTSPKQGFLLATNASALVIGSPFVIVLFPIMIIFTEVRYCLNCCFPSLRERWSEASSNW